MVLKIFLCTFTYVNLFNSAPELGLIHDVDKHGPNEGRGFTAARLCDPYDVTSAQEGRDTHGLDGGRGGELAFAD